MLSKLNVVKAALASVALLGFGAANAEEANGSLSFFGLYQNKDSTSTANFNMALERFFFHHRVGVSPRLSLMLMESKDTQLTYSSTGAITGSKTTTSTLTTTGLGLGADFYFREMGRKGSLVPFVGLGADYFSVSNGGTAFSSVYGEAGIKMFLSERASFDARAQLKSNQSTGYGTSSSSETDFLFGLSVYF